MNIKDDHDILAKWKPVKYRVHCSLPMRLVAMILFMASLGALFASLSSWQRGFPQEESSQEFKTLPLHSWIVASRNDMFGNSPERQWNTPELRLHTMLYFLFKGLIEADLLQSSEVIVVEWNMEVNSSFNLQEYAGTGRLRHMVVPPETARKYADVPVSEVHALNAAFRRAQGKILWRLDQDTVPHAAFFHWLAREALSPGFEANCLFWGQRRDCGFSSLVVDNAVDLNTASSATEMIPHYITSMEGLMSKSEVELKNENVCGPWGSHPTPENPNGDLAVLPLFLGAVGIMGLPRSMVFLSNGYCEQLTKWGHMELEFKDRVIRKWEEDPRACTYHMTEHWNQTKTSMAVPFFHLPHTTGRDVNNLSGGCAQEYSQLNDAWGLKNELDIHERIL